jgi:hypothetical protein
MSGPMTTSHSPALHVNVAVASDPGARRPSTSKANSTISFPSPPTDSVQSSLNISQVLEMNMTYPHISVCRCVTDRTRRGVYATHTHTRSLHMEVQIASPSVKVVHQEELQTSRSLPVFHENDRVGGRIILDPACYQSGRLSISVRTFILFHARVPYERTVISSKEYFTILLHKHKQSMNHTTKNLAMAGTFSCLRQMSSQLAHLLI